MTSPHRPDSVFLNLSVEIGPRAAWYRMTAEPGGWTIVDTQGDPLYRSVHNVTPDDVAFDIAGATVGHDFDGMWEVRSVRRDPAAVAADVCGVECTERPEDMPPGAQMMRVGPCKLPPRHEDPRHDPKLGGVAQAILAMDHDAAEELAEITIGALAVVWRAINRTTIKAGAGAMDDDELYKIVCKGVEKMLAPEGGYETALVLLRALMARQIKAEAAR